MSDFLFPIIEIFLGLVLVSCGDSAEEKNTKRICDNFSKKINLDKNKCYKDKEYFKELRIEHNVILQTEEIENFNKNVENFNKIDVGIDKISYELVDIERYFYLQSNGYAPRVRELGKRAVTILTSRGCPHQCVFCSIQTTMGYKWRYHSPQYVKRHIEILADRYAVDYIHFEDD